jgi:hypothetical protein
MQHYRWLHLVFCFGLLKPLSRLSILFPAQHKQRTLHAFTVINPLSHFKEPASCFSAYGGLGGYCPHVQNAYFVCLNDLSIVFIIAYFVEMSKPLFSSADVIFS